jgi:hypothetical protein
MTTPATARASDISVQLGNDLASLASHAAVELDELILGRAKSLSAVEQLAVVISELLASPDPNQVVTRADPRMMVAVGRAINDSGLAQTTTVEGLRHEATVLSQMLLSLTRPETTLPKMEALERMRGFCLRLSKIALASRRSGQEFQQRHPLRR